MKKMLGQKGQAFSVFQLLISAIIAVVILTLLLSIIGLIDIFGQSNPQKEAGTIVNDLVTQPASTRTSKQVIFETNDSLTNRGIASLTRGSLSDNQVCVLAGEFDNDQRFKYIEGISVIYTGSGKQNAQISAICDTGSVMANYSGSGGDYFDQFTAGAISGSWASVCECIDGQSPQKCCIVALKKARG